MDFLRFLRAPSAKKVVREMLTGEASSNQLLINLTDAEWYSQLTAEMDEVDDAIDDEEADQLFVRLQEVMTTSLADSDAQEQLDAAAASATEIMTNLFGSNASSIIGTIRQTLSDSIGSAFDLSAMIQNTITRLMAVTEPSTRRTASEEVINNLPVEAELVNEEVCFCSRDREVGELYEIATLPCQHRFDLNCIREWLRRCHTCPNCRYPLLTGDAEYDSQYDDERRRRLPHPEVD